MQRSQLPQTQVRYQLLPGRCIVGEGDKNTILGNFQSTGFLDPKNKMLRVHYEGENGDLVVIVSPAVLTGLHPVGPNKPLFTLTVPIGHPEQERNTELVNTVMTSRENRGVLLDSLRAFLSAALALCNKADKTGITDDRGMILELVPGGEVKQYPPAIRKSNVLRNHRRWGF